MNVVQELERAIRQKDPDALEDAINCVDPKSVNDPRLVPVLCDLLSATWHECHEDIALTLQQIRDPRASRALGQAAILKFEYLDYDNSYAFARKCIWALADIGTDEAKQWLLELSKVEDPTIAGYATRRLDLWMEELDRKGPPQ
jgi:hypothetical protein